MDIWLELLLGLLSVKILPQVKLRDFIETEKQAKTDQSKHKTSVELVSGSDASATDNKGRDHRKVSPGCCVEQPGTSSSSSGQLEFT